MEATSEDYFRFDVLGTPGSAWNKSAARVFADFTIRQLCLPNTVQMFQALQRAFKSHLETIIRRYKASLKPHAEHLLFQSLSRRQVRKYQLFHQRRYLAYMFEPLRRHIAMLEQLGVDGMSSDESDRDEDYHSQYQIQDPLWRARELAAWLRVFDSLHHILRKSGDCFASRGAFPRHRKVGGRRSTNPKFVPGLPINVYDHQWISSDAKRKYDLRPLPEHYDFSHNANVMECVKSWHIPLISH
ncbi:hypothetical protein C8R47DRAFT_998918 [Mycena vitilis]|nr:hypothetical protein C8R47DRAFT_998918 [Mycena vitilis]